MPTWMTSLLLKSCENGFRALLGHGRLRTDDRRAGFTPHPHSCVPIYRYGVPVMAFPASRRSHSMEWRSKVLGLLVIGRSYGLTLAASHDQSALGSKKVCRQGPRSRQDMGTLGCWLARNQLKIHSISRFMLSIACKSIKNIGNAIGPCLAFPPGHRTTQ